MLHTSTSQFGTVGFNQMVKLRLFMYARLCTHAVICTCAPAYLGGGIFTLTLQSAEAAPLLGLAPNVALCAQADRELHILGSAARGGGAVGLSGSRPAAPGMPAKQVDRPSCCMRPLKFSQKQHPRQARQCLWAGASRESPLDATPKATELHSVLQT